MYCKDLTKHFLFLFFETDNKMGKITLFCIIKTISSSLQYRRLRVAYSELKAKAAIDVIQLCLAVFTQSGPQDQ